MKTFLFLAAAVLFGVFAFIQANEKIPVRVVEINMSPAEYSIANPVEYSDKTSYLYKSDSPKWKKSYRYIFFSQGVSGFEGKKYLQNHPEDAVEVYIEKPDGNMFVIFSNQPPDKEYFQATNM